MLSVRPSAAGGKLTDEPVWNTAFVLAGCGCVAGHGIVVAIGRQRLGHICKSGCTQRIRAVAALALQQTDPGT